MRNAASSRRREEDIAGSYPGTGTAATLRRALPSLAIALAGCLAGTPAVAMAATTPSDATAPAIPAAVVEQTRRALSVTRDVLSVPAHQSTGTILVGGREMGSVETFAQRNPPALRETMELAGVRQTITLLGDEAWIEDMNGSVRALTGAELQAVRAAHVLLFHDYLHADGAVAATPDGAAFRLGKDAGRELRLGENFLPETFHQSVEGSATVTRFTEWEEVDGVLWPHVAHQSSGDSRFDMTIRTTSASYPDRLPAASIPRPEVGTARDFEFAEATGALAIPIDFAGTLPLVPLQVNGRSASFLLDTGAGATVLAPGLARRLDLVPRGVM
ncbi:MAG: retroviral-like aspartic protease family protein, partial [Gemmatimonadetes bacterium]|nr:retroviral-like aspartic protease family protein [Gemmatimonadota bacterium]